MFIEEVKAGVMSEAPTIYEILLRIVQKILNFVGFLAILMILITAVIMMTCFDNDQQEELAKSYLRGSIIGLVVILLSLLLINNLIKLLT